MKGYWTWNTWKGDVEMVKNKPDIINKVCDQETKIEIFR